MRRTSGSQPADTRGFWSQFWLDTVHGLEGDVRHATRALARNPGFSLTVIGVLAVGIGLNIAVFTFLKGLTLSPVAGVNGSSRLALIVNELSSGQQRSLSYPDYRSMRQQVGAFSELFGVRATTVTLGRGRGARPIWTELVTGNYFRGLGVRAQLGRTLLPSDEVAPGSHPFAVMSDMLWRRDFNADPQIVGKTIEVNGYPLTVVGVADRAFHGTIVAYETELFIPLMMAAEIALPGTVGGRPGAPHALTNRAVPIVVPHGFLRPGATIDTAAEQVAGAWATLVRARPLAEAQRMRVLPFSQSPFGGQRYLLPVVSVLTVMGLLILVITCANLAALVLARGASRRADIAARQALGATRARTIRMLMVESLLIAVPGAALGLLLAWRSFDPLVAFFNRAAAPQRVFANLTVDGFVFGFTLAVGCGCALLFGLVPALRSSRNQLSTIMREELAPRGAARGPLHASLVVAQVAVSFVLLVGAGLATRSFLAAQRAERGFDERQVTSVAVDLRANTYDEVRGRVFYRRLLGLARGAPGVESATLAEFNPLNFFETRSQRMSVRGYEARRGEALLFLSNAVASDYFRTLRIDLLAGRPFEDKDDENAAHVAIVNDTFARRFWRDAGSAIGQQIRFTGEEWRTVVGVAADVKYVRIDESPRPYVYVPILQSYRPNVVLHTRGPAPVPALVDQARGFVSATDDDVPILAQPLAEATSGALFFIRLMASALFLFGACGMVLAALGTYGLVAYVVRQSTREIGVRTALGASGLVVARGFVWRGLQLGAIGAVLGTVAALGLRALLGSMLFGVSAFDGVSFGVAAAIVVGAVLAASIIPAWRAIRTDPLRALRHF